MKCELFIYVVMIKQRKNPCTVYTVEGFVKLKIDHVQRCWTAQQ